jgi:hypothetical protein
MRRDPGPLLTAAATAVVSCGLLALAIAYGWLGPDVGRGADFCEAPRSGPIRQPANTVSNLGFVVAGLLIAEHASRRQQGANRGLPSGLATVMAAIVVLLGPASAAMHATQSWLGGQLDQLSMALIAAFAASYAFLRWHRGGPRWFAGAFTVAVAGAVLMGQWPGEVPVVRHPGNLAFALLLLVAVGLELAIIRRGDVRTRPVFAAAAAGTMLVAFALWIATNAGLCDPYSPLQGHAIWHGLSAVAAYLLYRYYASATGTTPALPVLRQPDRYRASQTDTAPTPRAAT